MKCFLSLLVLLILVQSIYTQTSVKKDISNIKNKVDSLCDINNGYDLKTESNAKIYTQWEKGILIQKDGERISGLIKIKKTPVSELMPIKIEFKESDLDKGKTLRADKIKGFEKGNRLYLSKQFKDLPPSFIEVLDSGSINLYIFKCYDEHSVGPKRFKVHLYIETQNETLIEINAKKLSSQHLDYFKKVKVIQEFITSEYYSKEHFITLVKLYNELSNEL